MFTHRDFPLVQTGVQVPAGTCRAGEPLGDAMLREIAEETGYDCFALGRFLGEGEYRAGDETHVRSYFEVLTIAPLPERWVAGEDHDGRRERTVFEFFWIPLADGHVLAAGLGARLADL